MRSSQWRRCGLQCAQQGQRHLFKFNRTYVRLNTFDITTAGLSVTGTSGASITIEQIAAALTNITSSGTGVNLASSGGAGNLLLSYQSGTITAGTTGISAVAAGTGNVGVNIGAAATVNAGTNRGILAQSASGNVSVTNAGTIRSTSNAGIDARVNAAGAGSVTVVSSGNITAGTSAILATNAGNGGIAITTAAGTNLAAGTAQGISAVDSGTAGGITITADGTIGATTAVGGVGLLANVNNASNTGAIAINTGGTISATGDAIRATNAGAGNVSVDVGAATTSANGSGVVATAARGDVSVEAAANIQGRLGISCDKLEHGRDRQNRCHGRSWCCHHLDGGNCANGHERRKPGRYSVDRGRKHYPVEWGCRHHHRCLRSCRRHFNRDPWDGGVLDQQRRDQCRDRQYQ